MSEARFRDNAGDPYQDLRILEEFPNCVTVEYTPPRQEIDSSIFSDDEKKVSRAFTHELMMINVQDNFISINPIITWPTQANYREQKYEQVKSITLEGFEFSTPDTIDELLDILENLPAGFVKTYSYGLGLQKNYRFIVEAIENIPEIEHLVISRNDETNIDGSIYTLNYHDFEAIRKGINRITDAHQRDGRVEKNIFSYNSLLHRLHPNKFKKKKKPYKKDIIYKFISATSCAQSLSDNDAEAVMKTLHDNREGLYEKKREKLLQLQQDIELLNFEWLITETEKLLSKNSSEPKWQKFLEQNPIILSLAFGYPVVKVKGAASVGGRNIFGKGDKITDFLIKNNLTNNTALVEIKKSGTQLLYKTAYRDGVYAPSRELSGAINQVLDQKYKFQQEISTLKVNSKIYDIETYSVDCVVIIGTMPTNEERVKSFELYRHNMKDVKISTFDEMLQKLKNIYLTLQSQPSGR